MKEESNEAQKGPIEECAAQLNNAAQALERVIGKLEAQYEALNQKIDRIIATVEKQAGGESGEPAAVNAQVERTAELEKRIANCASARAARRCPGSEHSAGKERGCRGRAD